MWCDSKATNRAAEVVCTGLDCEQSRNSKYPAMVIPQAEIGEKAPVMVNSEQDAGACVISSVTPDSPAEFIGMRDWVVSAKFDPRASES